MTRTRFFFPVILAWLAALLWAASVSAQQQTPLPLSSITDDQVNAVAHELYCPVCENISLDVCPTQACAQWRDLIRQKLAGGWSKQQIKDYFANQYGDRVLGEPPAVGLNLLVYILPPVFLIAGLLVVVRIMLNNRKKPIPATPAAPASADPYIQRLEEELKKRR